MQHSLEECLFNTKSVSNLMFFISLCVNSEGSAQHYLDVNGHQIFENVILLLYTSLLDKLSK